MLGLDDDASQLVVWHPGDAVSLIRAITAALAPVAYEGGVVAALFGGFTLV